MVTATSSARVQQSVLAVVKAIQMMQMYNAPTHQNVQIVQAITQRTARTAPDGRLKNRFNRLKQQTTSASLKPDAKLNQKPHLAGQPSLLSFLFHLGTKTAYVP